MKILVADDSVTMRKILAMTFAGEAVEVVAVASGPESLERARQLRPDVVFVDASLAGSDPYEVARTLKSDPACGSPAVLVLSSQHTPYDADKGSAAGVDDHVVKPFDTQMVIDKVAKLATRGRTSSTNVPAAARPAPPPPPAAGPVPSRPAAPAPASAPPRPSRSTIAFGAPAVAAPARPAPAPARPMAPTPIAMPRVGAEAEAAVATEISERPAPSRAPAPAPVSSAASTAVDGMGERLAAMGLTAEQVKGVLALSREVVERVVWEVVPDLAETMIREEIRRLTSQ